MAFAPHPSMLNPQEPQNTDERLPDRPPTYEFHRFLEHTVAAWRSTRPPPLRAFRDLAEAWRIAEALRSCSGNRSAAARELGIGRRTLYAKMEKFGIEPSWKA